MCVSLWVCRSRNAHTTHTHVAWSKFSITPHPHPHPQKREKMCICLKSVVLFFFIQKQLPSTLSTASGCVASGVSSLRLVRVFTITERKTNIRLMNPVTVTWRFTLIWNSLISSHTNQNESMSSPQHCLALIQCTPGSLPSDGYILVSQNHCAWHILTFRCVHRSNVTYVPEKKCNPRN